MRSEAGFTLLEILVALAVFSIVALTALVNNNFMIDNSKYIQDKTLAHWVAMNKASELQLAGTWLVKENEEGVAVMAGRRWNWKAVGKATPDTDIQEVNIQVVSAEEESAAAVRTDLTIYLGKYSGLNFTGGSSAPPPTGSGGQDG